MLFIHYLLLILLLKSIFKFITSGLIILKILRLE